MLPAGRHDQAGNAGADALGTVPGRWQANLRVGVGPVAAAQEVACVFWGALDPGEAGVRIIGQGMETPPSEAKADHCRSLRSKAGLLRSGKQAQLSLGSSPSS